MKKYNTISVNEYLRYRESVPKDFTNTANGIIVTNLSAKKKSEKETIEFLRTFCH